MGLYDRDYVRQEPRGRFLGGSRTMVTNLILLCVAIFLADILLFDGRLSSFLALKANLLSQPWNVWQLISYGFAHDSKSILHVGFNMFGLWLFGRDMEIVYGRKEFLRIYLLLIVVSALVWVTSQYAFHSVGQGGPQGRLVGASGGVMGIMVLYVLHYPRRLFYLWGVVPVPVWVLATLWIAMDLMGWSRSMQGMGENVAYEAHLAGAATAFLYYRWGFNLGRWLPGGFWLKSLKPGPKLRVHEPSAEEQEDLSDRVDRILDKINRQGEASLTDAERRTLEDASRRYQQRRR